jgi:hypothetical protein
MAKYTKPCDTCHEDFTLYNKADLANRTTCHPCVEKARTKEIDAFRLRLAEKLATIERFSEKNGTIENLYVELKHDVDEKAAELSRDFAYLAESLTRAAETLKRRAAERKPSESYLGINSLGEVQQKGNELDRKAGELFATLKTLNLVEYEIGHDLKSYEKKLAEAGISPTPHDSRLD